MPLYSHLRIPGHLPQAEVDAGVEHNQGEQRDEAVDDEVHVDDINLVIVTILTKTCANNNQILWTYINVIMKSFDEKCLTSTSNV